MIEWLKWKVAGREMAELERWRVGCTDARRWLAEFPDAGDALDNVYEVAHGITPYGTLSSLRDAMRRRRDSGARADHWAELQEHGWPAHRIARANRLEAATAGPADAGEPADIREGARNLYPLWYTLLVAAGLGMLALVVRWWIPIS